MEKSIKEDADYPPPKTIVFIGPNGKETWIGSETGLKDMYPFARIVKVG